MENGADSEARDPSGFLSQIIGAPVIVKLNSGIVFKGENLRTLDAVICLTSPLFYRGASIRRWLYEHCFGERRGMG